MIARWLFLLCLAAATPALAQQNVRVPVDGVQLGAQLYRPAGAGKVPAVAIFHGCGGVGINNTRMAGLLRDWGYAALVVDSFTARRMTDVCGRHWPTQAEAEAREKDIDAALAWLAHQDFVDPGRLAFMGYSYGGGVALLRAFQPRAPQAKAAVLLYPDCGLGDPLGAAPQPRQPTLFALGELDDWTPARQCQSLIDRVKVGGTLIETHVYAGAHHSFDALGLPVRYLDGVGNRSKPGGCCGAHYGANEAAWKAFVADVRAFLERTLR
ncbi:MAG: dienelactone hydrolase family protein [Proteobacteria bacterium]|nr:dienelactone hydrolase family protein [Pseudomonadota bacterium]